MTIDIHSLVGAYVLDAVDDLERVAFERHLAECDTCRLEVDELREAAGRLADSTWSVPPPRLRTDVLTAIGRTRQLSQPSPVTTAARTSQWRRRTLAAAAAVVLAAGTGTAVYSVQEQRVRDQQSVTEAARQRETRIQQILAAADVVYRTGSVAGGGKVTVASSGSYRAGVILMTADAVPADGRVFQLWTIRGLTPPANAGVLQPGQTSVVQIVDGLPGSSQVAVSVEPAGGSPQPTLPVGSVELV